jgi:hypothetical protein
MNTAGASAINIETVVPSTTFASAWKQAARARSQIGSCAHFHQKEGDEGSHERAGPVRSGMLSNASVRNAHTPSFDAPRLTSQLSAGRGTMSASHTPTEPASAWFSRVAASSRDDGSGGEIALQRNKARNCVLSSILRLLPERLKLRMPA